jgi:pre-rRNA-processing protein IPI3
VDLQAWDLASKTLLSTFHLPSPLSHLVLDPSERMIYAASTSTTGEIYQINLFQPRENPLTSHDDMEMEYEALGGGGRGDIIRIEVDSGSARRKRVFDTGATVTAMTLNLTCSNLLVGTSTGQIQIFDITSHQHVRTFVPAASTASSGPTFAITHLHTCLRPSDLVGHVALNSGGVAGKEADHLPIPRYVAPFQRTRDAKAREAHEVWVHLSRSSRHLPALDYSEQDMLSDLAFFRPADAVSASGTPMSVENTPATSAKVKALEEEVQRLKDQLGKAKGVNDRMWEVVVNKVVADARAGENMEVPDDAQEQRSRKRGRK